MTPRGITPATVIPPQVSHLFFGYCETRYHSRYHSGFTAFYSTFHSGITVGITPKPRGITPPYIPLGIWSVIPASFWETMKNSIKIFCFLLRVMAHSHERNIHF